MSPYFKAPAPMDMDQDCRAYQHRPVCLGSPTSSHSWTGSGRPGGCSLSVDLTACSSACMVATAAIAGSAHITGVKLACGPCLPRAFLFLTAQLPQAEPTRAM